MVEGSERSGVGEEAGQDKCEHGENYICWSNRLLCSAAVGHERTSVCLFCLCPSLFFPFLSDPSSMLPFSPALRSPASYIPLFILGPAPLIPSFSVVGRPASAALASSAWPCQALNGPGMSAVGPGWILLAPINFAGNYASQSKYFTPPDFFSL